MSVGAVTVTEIHYNRPMLFGPAADSVRMWLGRSLCDVARAAKIPLARLSAILRGREKPEHTEAWQIIVALDLNIHGRRSGDDPSYLLACLGDGDSRAVEVSRESREVLALVDSTAEITANCGPAPDDPYQSGAAQ